jgi:hypothetical protein
MGFRNDTRDAVVRQHDLTSDLPRLFSRLAALGAGPQVSGVIGNG